MRILYLDIDSLRPDHLGCYGYHRPTSPNIDRIAARGVRFNQVYCSDAPCLPSRTALYSGRFGLQTGVVGHGGTAAQPRIEGATRGFRDLFDSTGLARQLQLAGFHTTMVSPFGQRHAAHWFYAGFHEIHNTGKGGMESAEDVTPVVLPWLERHARDDHWYLHVNLWDPHTPYRAPASVGEPFADWPLPERLNDESLIRRHVKLTGPHTALDINMYDDAENPAYPRSPGKITDLASMRRMVDGYDTGVLWADHAVGQILERLSAAGVLDDTAIIVSADHGENMGELGIYGEHGTADVGTCRIPMIVSWPGLDQQRWGKADDHFHYGLDLAPTLCDLLKLPTPSVWDGQSFAAELRGETPKGPREELVLSQCAHVCQRSLRWGRYLYMRTYHCGFHLFPDEMLFDLEADPLEQCDLAATLPGVSQEAAWRLSRWHDAQMKRLTERTGHVDDPVWTVLRDGGPMHARHRPPAGLASPLPQYIQRLRDTGRSDGAAALEAKYIKA